MRRRIVKDAGIDPTNRNRHWYVLDCGHVVCRRTNNGKRQAECGECEKTVDFADNSILDSATREGGE